MKTLRHILPGAMLVMLLVSAGCQSEAERLHSESLYHLNKVLYILEHSEGKTDVAMAELDKFFAKYEDRLEANRNDGKQAMKKMSQSERERFARLALERSKTVKERIDTIVRTFPDPPRLFRKLREIL